MKNGMIPRGPTFFMSAAEYNLRANVTIRMPKMIPRTPAAGFPSTKYPMPLRNVRAPPMRLSAYPVFGFFPVVDASFSTWGAPEATALPVIWAPQLGQKALPSSTALPQFGQYNPDSPSAGPALFYLS